jgi:4-carboxymuconolactone decarboxylase
MFGRMLLALGCLAASAIGAAAQDRMPPLAADKLNEAQKKAVDEFKAARNADVTGPFVPLLRSPEVMSRARAMGDYLRFRSVLPPRLSEFVILMTARAWTQQYEWDAHYRLALNAGLKEDTAKAIAEGRRPQGMLDDEALLYVFCDEVRKNQGVSDQTYSRMVATFGEQGVIDTVGIMGYYTTLAMVMNTARTPLPAGTPPPLKPLAR